MTYDTLANTTKYPVSQDLTQLLVYANDVTNGWFAPLVVLSFWFVVFLSSIFMQLRFSGRIRADTSCLAACFATLGMTAILEQRTGILDPLYFILLIFLTIISLLWVFLTNQD